MKNSQDIDEMYQQRLEDMEKMLDLWDDMGYNENTLKDYDPLEDHEVLELYTEYEQESKNG